MILEDFQFEIEEKVLEYILQSECFSNDIKVAKTIFYADQAEDDFNISHMDFNTWLIYDYKNNDNKTFIQQFSLSKKGQIPSKELDILEKVGNTYSSIYELKELPKGKGLIKDIFTKKEYLVDEDLSILKFGDLIFSRIIEFEGNYKLFGNKVLIPGGFKTSIERSIIPQFDRYKIQNQFGAWEEFLEDNRLLLYKYAGVAMDLIHNQNQEEEEEYQVWQSLYLVKDLEEVKEKLKGSKTIQLDFEENGSRYYKIIENESMLAEFVLTDKRGELECRSDSDREQAKLIIESELKDIIKHYKDEIMSLDDII